MTPIYLNAQTSSSLIEDHGYHHQHEHEYDHDHEREVLMISPKSQASSSSPCPTFYDSSTTSLGHHLEIDICASHIGSYDHQSKEGKGKYSFKLPIWKKKYFNKNEDQSGQYDESKTLVASFEKDQNSYNNNSSITIRVCSDCNTTKTPLWRSGPSGPKSLCNACGIRQRKARRALAASAAEANGTNIYAMSKISHVKTKVQHKDKKKPIKKKQLGIANSTSSSSTITTTTTNRSCFEDFTLSLSEKYSAFQRVFPRDEREEAAILLMALSYGLVS